MIGLSPLSVSASCRHFADKLFSTPWHRVALTGTRATLGQDKKAQIAIWSDGVACYASYFQAGCVRILDS